MIICRKLIWFLCYGLRNRIWVELVLIESWRVYRNSVPPMPDNRQVKSNAVANPSADNIEGSLDFLCTFGGRGIWFCHFLFSKWLFDGRIVNFCDRIWLFLWRCLFVLFYVENFDTLYASFYRSHVGIAIFHPCQLWRNAWIWLWIIRNCWSWKVFKLFVLIFF